MKKFVVLVTVTLLLLSILNFTVLKHVEATQFEISKVYIYYDPRYPDAWLDLWKSGILKNYTSSTFEEYGIPYEIVDADGLRNVCLDLVNANETIVVMAMDVAPDTIWDGSPDGSIVEAWLEAGGTMIWKGDFQFYYIGHSDGSREHLGNIESYVFDRYVTGWVGLNTNSTSLGANYLPGFESLYTDRPASRSLIEGLYYEAYGSGIVDGEEYLDPVLFQAGSDANGYFIMAGMSSANLTAEDLSGAKVVSELVLNRFFNLGVETLPRTETFTPQEIKPYFTADMLVPALRMGKIYYKPRQEWARMIAQNLTNIGIESRVHFVTDWEIASRVYWQSELGATYSKGGFDIHLYGLTLGDEIWPMNETAFMLRDRFHSSNMPGSGTGFNVLLWNNSRNDQLLDEMQATTNETDLENLLKQWQALCYEEQPLEIIGYGQWNWEDFHSKYTWWEFGFNMLHPIFGTGVETPLGQNDSSRAAEAARYVRQAVSHTIPREYIITTLELNATPGITPVYPGFPGFDSSLEPYEYNLTRAKELMALAGYGMTVTAASPVNLWITDSLDRHVGSDPQTGEIVNEIPGATYSGPGTEPQVVWIPNPEGAYDVNVVGTASGTYTLTVTNINQLTQTGSVDVGTADSYELSMTPTGVHEGIPEAAVDFDPDRLNLKSNGNWATVYIEFLTDFNVRDIDLTTIMLNSTFYVDPAAPTQVGDYDMDGVPDLMVKFDRASLVAWLGTVDLDYETGRSFQAKLTVTGEIFGISFSATDTITVLLKG